MLRKLQLPPQKSVTAGAFPRSERNNAKKLEKFQMSHIHFQGAWDTQGTKSVGVQLFLKVLSAPKVWVFGALG